MDKIFILFIMILLIIVLLLTISILIIFLWCALLFLRSLLPYMMKKEKAKRKKRNNKSAISKERTNNERINNSKFREDQNPKWYRTTEFIPEEKSDVSFKKESQTENLHENQIMSITNDKNIYEKRELKYKEEYRESELMDIITGNVYKNFPRISMLSPSEKNRYDFVARFIENPDGKLAILNEEKEVYLTIPVSAIINEKDYSYGEIGSSYIFDKEVRAGKQYRITGIKKVCKMKRDESRYFSILEKGSLVIEEINY